MHRPPMLILGAQHDHLIPPAQVHMTAAVYGTTAEIIPDIGHGAMLERDWRGVAERIARWLAKRVT
jgi:non-heme chloroperoxidase